MPSPLLRELAWMGLTLVGGAAVIVGLLTATWALTIPAGLAVLISHRHWMK
jgi:hypothetical protein